MSRAAVISEEREMEGLWEEAGRNVSVVVQDKESASQYRATTGLPRFFRSFFVRHGDAHASEWRAPRSSRCVTVSTTRRGEREKPFGWSEEHARRMAVALVLGLMAFAGPVALGRLFRLRITLTDSAAPAGIYRLINVPVERGELVAACLPSAIARTGLMHGYLREGDCPAEAEPVAKVVGAVPDDVVEVEPGWVAVDGVKFADSRASARDSSGRALGHAAWGARRVGPGEIWLFGFNDPRSWDARYFGPVPLAGVRGVLRPVLTW